jgi:hypothetical protein
MSCVGQHLCKLDDAYLRQAGSDVTNIESKYLSIRAWKGMINSWCPNTPMIVDKLDDFMRLGEDAGDYLFRLRDACSCENL